MPRTAAAVGAIADFVDRKLLQFIKLRDEPGVTTLEINSSHTQHPSVQPHS